MLISFNFNMEQISHSKRIWSWKVVTFFSIISLPISGAILAAINYMIIGRIKKGILFIFEILGLSVILSILLHFFSKNLELNGFIVAIIMAFIIFRDQRQLFWRWQEEYAGIKTRPWLSALIVVIVADLIIGILLYFLGS